MKVINVKKNNKIIEKQNKESVIDRYLKRKMENEKTVMRSIDNPPSKKTMALATAAIIPAVPATAAATTYKIATDIAGGIIKTAGNIISFPTNLLATGLLVIGENSRHRFSEFVFKGTGFIAAIPGIAVDTVTSLASGILKLSSDMINLAAYAINTPFRACSISILKNANKKNLEKADIVIEQVLE